MKLKFIVPWYGDNIVGGAETLARAYAERLTHDYEDFEVLTTTCENFHTNWAQNHYPEGRTDLNGVTVRRFRVDSRNQKLFDAINRKLLLGIYVSGIEEEQFFSESINSSSLLDYIRNRGKDAVLVFIPYLYGPIYYGSEIHPENSVIIPCLHNENYAYMVAVREMMKRFAGIIFNSKEEADLARRIYDDDIESRSMILGMGVDCDRYNAGIDARRFRQKFGIEGDFVLYAGRRDITKNTPFLIQAFCKYLQDERRPVRLVLIGRGAVDVPREFRPFIIDLGYISERDKLDAYNAATLLCQPSLNESFSIVLMESWLCGTPVVVNGFCPVTKGHCICSQGGLYFNDYLEFREILNFLLDNPDKREELARNGKRYVEESFDWTHILGKFKSWISNRFQS